MKGILPFALAMALGLAGVIYLELQSLVEPDAGAAPGRPPASAAVASPAPGREEAAQDWGATALGRPLFSTDRRPAHAAEVTAAKAAQDMRLTGVIAGPFGRRAILVVAGNAKPVVVEAGDRVGGAVVREIGKGQVVVEADGAVRTLAMPFMTAASPPRS
jgi:Type II secretion system protein C